MSETTYQILFKGKTVRGYDAEKAKQNFAKLFKLPAQKVDVLFNGSERVLKKSLTLQQANDFRAKLKQFGIRVSLKQNVVEAPQTAAELSLSAPGVMLIPPVKKTEVHIEVTHLNFSDESGPIVEKAVVEEPELDLSALQLDEVGEQIVEKQSIEVPDIATEGLILDEPGVTVVEKQVVPMPDISMDGLSLDEVGVDIVLKEKKPPADIATDHIQLLEEEEIDEVEE
ncbi:hypothetical protein [Marinicella sp. W31]|uniref:hypothetical protein n=1 Tax=Marinicella sp. W31 TaxID=3023713 RepID=UPI0037573CA9